MAEPAAARWDSRAFHVVERSSTHILAVCGAGRQYGGTMPTDTLTVVDVLSREEYDTIDSFCAQDTGSDSLEPLAGFLRERFDVALDLDPDIVTGFTVDSSNLDGSARGLGRPASERECAILLRACFAAGIPVTVSAGKSNLTGSATPPGGVVIATNKMTQPGPRLDVDAATVDAPVGMILEDMRTFVLERSDRALAYAVDPTSRAEATVGGTVACNASGFTPGIMGATRPWVRRVRVLLPDGTAVEAERGACVSSGGRFLLARGDGTSEFPVPTHPRPAIKNAGGPYSSSDGAVDFVDLIVGSEGLFGVVTACTLGLAKRPAEYLDLFFSLPDECEALKLHAYLTDNLEGGVESLTAFEYFGINCREHMDHQERLFRGDDQVGIYLQVPLRDADADAEEAAMEWLERLLASGCAIDEEAILLLDNERDRAIFMEARHSMPANALEVVKHRGSFTIMTDTVVPADRFAEFLAFTHGRLGDEKLDYLSFGHFGDCHLHFTILPHKQDIERATGVYDEIVAKSAELGGVYSGEHGTGKRKRKDFLRCYGDEAAQRVLACKRAVDPRLLLNRGNVVEV